MTAGPARRACRSSCTTRLPRPRRPPAGWLSPRRPSPSRSPTCTSAGFETVTAARLAQIMASQAGRLPDRAVVLTFDDGFEDFHRRAMPVLDQYGYTATVFVTTGWVQDAGPHAAGRRPGRMLSWSQIAEVAQAGMEVGAHSWQHPQLDQLRGSAPPGGAVREQSAPRGPARRPRARPGLPLRLFQRQGPAGGPRGRLRLRLRGQQRPW